MSATQFLLLFALLASSVACGVPCSQQWECSGVSTDYNFVQCINRECACRNGFNGSATEDDKCRCDYTVAWGNGDPFCKICVAPRHIVYQDGLPYCLHEAECESLTAQEEREAIRISQVQKVYTNLIYPKPFEIISGQAPEVDDIFADNVKGRITPLGSFDNFVAVEEYFYGLGASQSSRVDYVTFKSISASGDYVAVEVDIFFNYSRVGRPSRNLTQTGFYKFDSENKIESIDLTILNIGFAIDGLTASAAARNGSIIRLCNTLLVSPRYCPPETDPAGHYTDVNDCITFMHSIPFGSWNQAHSNTVTCRNLHALLTAFRPLEHCPHAGKTGGMKCIDEPYETFYEEDY